MVRKRKLGPITATKKGDDKEGPTTIVVDSSGISTTKKGPYIEQMWRRERRKFIKLHIMADRKGKVVGFRVTSERTGDTKKFVPLVKETVRKKGNVTKAYAIKPILLGVGDGVRCGEEPRASHSGRSLRPCP
ncbi:MAG: transposase [Thermoplasmatales archaeon]